MWGITYTAGAATVADLAYAYDSAGHQAQVSGSLVRSSLPAAVATSTYDAANRLTSWNGGAASPTYDLDGNLTADGTSNYSWDARGQLAAVHQGASTTAAYAYDA